MHEYSIVSALIDRIDREARARDAVRVARVRVKIGALSGVEADLLKTAYEMFRQGTLCEGADLEVVPVEARWACGACGEAVTPGGPLRCRSCGAAARLEAGDEILLE